MSYKTIIFLVLGLVMLSSAFPRDDPADDNLAYGAGLRRVRRSPADDNLAYGAGLRRVRRSPAEINLAYGAGLRRVRRSEDVDPCSYQFDFSQGDCREVDMKWGFNQFYGECQEM